MIRLSIPSIEEDDIQSVSEVLKTGFLVQGPQVANFEKLVAELVGTTYAVAVTNCTAALQMALLALDVRPGDLVVVTSYSWISTANVIELCGAQPIFTDIDPHTFNMCPDSLAEVLERLFANKDTARRVKAVLPVHTFGQMADMPRILDLAGRYNLPVVEDAACALGASLHGKQAGSWGVMGCFSFHPRKAITTGEGGVITTNDDQLAWRLRALRNHGMDPDSSVPSFLMPGFNNRMTEFQAALGITQMHKLERIVRARREAAQRYNRLLQATNLTPPAVFPESFHVYQSYVTLLPREAAPKRSQLIQHLKEKGIETTIGTWHMPLSDYFAKRYGYRVGDFPVTDDVFSRSLTLPLYETIALETQQTIAQRIDSLI
jgi:dTDP-4-amino-4,6-dideoxygalactose transaminase